MTVVLTCGCGSVRETELRNRSAKNLETIGRGMVLGYSDAHRCFPPYRIFHNDGRGKLEPVDLSWRVALLPHIGEEKLYRRFKLTEPWDSPTNIALLAEMPKVYALLPEEKEKGLTRYRIFVGEGLVFQPNASHARPIQADGAKNTIMVVEAAEAVPWTKPEELFLELDKVDLPPAKFKERMEAIQQALAKARLPKLGGAYRGGFHVVNFAAEVIFIRDDFDEALLRLAIHPEDGKRFDWKDLEGK